jgi:hypothetical protein
LTTDLFQILKNYWRFEAVILSGYGCDPVEKKTFLKVTQNETNTAL